MRGSPVTLTDPNGLEVPSPEREKELAIAPLPPEQPRDDRFTAEGVGKGALNSLLDRFADVSKGLMIAVAPLGAHRVTSDAPQTPMMQAVQQVDKAIEEGNYKDVSPSEEFAGAIAVFAAELALGAALGKLAAPRALVGPAATHASPPSSPSGPSRSLGRALDWLGEKMFPNAVRQPVTPEGVRVKVAEAGPEFEGRSLSIGGAGAGGGDRVAAPTTKSSPFGPKIADVIPSRGVPQNWNAEQIADAIEDYKASITSRRAELGAFDEAGEGTATQRLAHARRITDEEAFLRSLEKALESRR